MPAEARRFPFPPGFPHEGEIMWIMKFNDQEGKWTVGYTMRVQAGYDKFVTIYYKASQGEAADMCHYLNGGEKH